MRQEEPQPEPESKLTAPLADEEVVNPVDGESTSISAFSLGKQTKARITSIKETQLNVQLADNLQGRTDVSELFDSFDDIKDKRRPLSAFKTKQTLPVKILGIHDAKNHRFLPITHRKSRIPVFELTAKSSTTVESEADVLSLNNLKPGDPLVAFVNNITDSCLWVNVSPNVRGRIDLMDVSDDVALLQDLDENFPVGSALKVRVKTVDMSKGRLDLTASTSDKQGPQSLHELSAGMLLPGRVAKVTERSLIVALSDSITGAVPLTEITDDFDEAKPSAFGKNSVVRVCVVEVDLSNKRLFLSVRPSKVLSSALPVKDASITSLTQLKPNTVVRGFVKLVRDNGLIIALGPRVEAFARVSDLSDAFVKDWKAEFQVDQLVTGKILAVDSALNHVQMSLKASHVDKNWVPPVSWSQLEEGETVVGKVRKVEDFGVFIDIDNTQPRVSGLCHRSEIADSKIGDVKGLFDEGDIVKAKILKVDVDKRRISFGLKASYFKDQVDADEDEDVSDAEDGATGSELDMVDAGDSSDDEGGIDLDLSNVQDIDSSDGEGKSAVTSNGVSLLDNTDGLKTSGFDWTGSSLAPASTNKPSSSASSKKKRKAEQTTTDDQTGDLDDSTTPSSTASFERHLLTSSHSSALWIQYMAFHLRLSDVSAARTIARRALRTIHIRETDEKLAIWIALLNLEVSYGDEESVTSVFEEACQVQDAYTVHERMAEIWTAAGRAEKADDVYTAMVGKKEFRSVSELWVKYAQFLFEHVVAAGKDGPGRARALLSRALLSVHERERRALTAKFASLEFKFEQGDAERGRTVFEGIVTEWPKWTAGWDMWVDLERGLLKRIKDEGEKEGDGSEGKAAKKRKTKAKSQGSDAEIQAAVTRVRGLYERMSKSRMKSRRAKFVFKRWLEFEEHEADEKAAERVKAIAKSYVENMKKAADEQDDEEE